MVKDIVPELWGQIEKTFDSKVQMDPVIKAFSTKVENGTAEGKDTFKYTQRLGEHASSTLSLYITPENMPEEKIHWNIATRTVLPLLRKVHQMVNNANCKVMSIEDKRNGIRIKPKEAAFPEERVNDLLNRLVDLELNEANNDD